MKHTPGPWTYQLQPLAKDFNAKEIDYETKEDYYSIQAGMGYYSFKRNNDTGFNACAYMTEANAKLICAAPELLEALQEAVCHVDSHFQPELKKKCEYAIKKATK